MGKLLDNLRKKHAGDTTKARRHSVNFLAHMDEITEALKEGWTTKQVWEQMIEDGMTTMSYASLCRLVKKHITASMDTANDSSPKAQTAPLPRPKSAKPSANSGSKSKTSKELTEKERLELLKDEAFSSVRSPKPSGPLIDNPKSREDERRELFG